MPKVTFLPHETLCPDGLVIDAEEGVSICDLALVNEIDIEHACEKSCACTTCHVYIRKGFDSLEESTENEDDMLDKAWGLEPESRLSCQTLTGKDDLFLKIFHIFSSSSRTGTVPFEEISSISDGLSLNKTSLNSTLILLKPLFL